MDEYSILRSMALRIGARSDTRFARALDEWAETHADWLGLGETRDWAAARAALEAAEPQATPHALAVAVIVAETLALSAFDTALLQLVVATERLPRVVTLARLWSEYSHNLPGLLGELAGANAVDADRAVRRSVVLRLGLIRLIANRDGVRLDTSWVLDRLLDSAADHDSVIASLIGQPQQARLALEDFAHVADADFLVRLLRGAAAGRAPGVNILIHGLPGTGKTELARTLAASAGLTLHAVGEADDDGDEPDRDDRINALYLAQRMLSPAEGAVLLFDEMEDMIGDAKPSAGDWFNARQGSKVFINRLLETNAVPVIWTSNAVGNVDAAILRRMSFVLNLGLPSPAAARRMLERIADEEQAVPEAGLTSLLDRAPETATVLRTALRSARLAGDAEGGARPAEALVRALRGSALPPDGNDPLDPALFESDPPLGPLLERLAAGGARDISILLTGPTGTGKTALAHHLARAVDRPLVVKRASDLLSRWVGGTEAAIAEAFAEARERGSALLFDEVDSLLFDRTTATYSWEAGQVNEMLTWLDRHPLPVIAATNHAHRLDPAALRRFVFKIELATLGPRRAAEAFTRFFAMAPPPELAQLTGLTPGDFAAVQRQLRHAPAASATEIVERLRREAAWRPASGRLGF